MNTPASNFISATSTIRRELELERETLLNQLYLNNVRMYQLNQFDAAGIVPAAAPTPEVPAEAVEQKPKRVRKPAATAKVRRDRRRAKPKAETVSSTTVEPAKPEQKKA